MEDRVYLKWVKERESESVQKRENERERERKRVRVYRLALVHTCLYVRVRETGD